MFRSLAHPDSVDLEMPIQEQQQERGRLPDVIRMSRHRESKRKNRI